ncbi:MAG: hypothetical protein ACLKAK_06845 [Alkaliphilus sp.]
MRKFSIKNKYIFLVLLSIALISIVYYLCSSDGFLDTASEVEAKIINNKSEIEYKEYLKITMYETEFSRRKDGKIDQLNYTAKLENISDKSINVNFKSFIAPELEKLVDDIWRSIGPLSRGRELEPGIKMNVGPPVLLRIPYEDLNDEEQQTLMRYKDILYLVIEINGKKAYVKITN